MRGLCLIFAVVFASVSAREFTVRFEDEQGRPVEKVSASVLLMGENDPTSQGMRNVRALTSAEGSISFSATNNMGVIRIEGQREGFYPVSLLESHRIPVPRPNQPQSFNLTIPRTIKPIPLYAKEARLSRGGGQLRRGEWVAFDLQRGSPLPPFGRGIVEDFRFRITATMTGWNATREYIERERQISPAKDWDEETIRGVYGNWRAELQLAFPHPQAGIVRSEKFWPYARLKMPHLAPSTGYLPELKAAYETGMPSEEGENEIGYYLRTRVTTDKDGKITEAHYAKILGRLGFSQGVLIFHYYFNPTPNDRNLEFDPSRNLLVPPPGTDSTELSYYQVSDP